MVLILTAFCMSAFTQVKNGFFRPVNKQMFQLKNVAVAPANIWIFRPAIEITATQLTWNKTTKVFDISSFQSMGLGVSYQHFISIDGLPYTNFGINALLLFDTTPIQTNEAALSGAITISALQYFNAGAGYNFGAKTLFLLLGITYNFN